MTYLDQWTALAGRIRGLMQAGQLHAHFLTVRKSDSYGRGRHLRGQCASVIDALEAFLARYQASLPPTAAAALDIFIKKNASLVRSQIDQSDLSEESVWAALVLLAALETEISFILSDVQQFVRSRSERAFAHLQRAIVADPEIRSKWQKAFAEGEIACEKLGALHLLLHGIWAFKVNTAGERTDLVFEEPVTIGGAEPQYADGLVLTEWKITKDRGDPTEHFRAARSQVRRYAQGSLAGNELTTYRYAIVVSTNHLNTPGDLAENGVVYRHINIAVDPKSPSQS